MRRLTTARLYKPSAGTPPLSAVHGCSLRKVPEFHKTLLAAFSVALMLLAVTPLTAAPAPAGSAGPGAAAVPSALPPVVPPAVPPTGASPASASPTATGANGDVVAPSDAATLKAGGNNQAGAGMVTAPNSGGGALMSGSRLAPVYALGDAIPQPLTEDEAVRLGLARNPQITAAAAGVASAQATYRAQLAFPPITLGVTNVTGTSAAPTLTGSTSDTFLDLGGTLDISGQRRLQAAGSRATFGAANFQLLETKLTLTQQIRDAYWSLAAAHAQTQFAQESLGDVQRVNQLTRQQLDAGASPRVDVLRSSIDLANARQGYLTTQGAERTALATLNVLLARTPTASLQLAANLIAPTTVATGTGAAIGPTPTTPAAALPPLPELTRTALSNRPAVQAAAQQVRAAEYGVKGARAARLPDLTVDYERSLRDPIATIVLGARLPVFDFGTIRQSVRAAEQSRRQAVAQQQQAEQQVVQQVAQAHLDYSQAQQVAASYQHDILEPSETLLHMAQLGYQQGGTGILPVLDAESTLRNARTGYINSLLALYKARDEVEAATGVLPR